MAQKLNKILLIDDSDADNFIHRRVIKKADAANDIVAMNSGKAALTYLSTKEEDGRYPTPELVFLDINMPGMNGWEFLDHYDQLPLEQQASIIVCMLTTSTAENDSGKAKQLPQIKSYLNKPLTEAMLRDVLQTFFPA